MKETNEDIERYAVKLIGVPAGAWVKTDQVHNTRGWERAYVFKANVGSRLLFGMYGVGQKGNYLLYLDTTPDDYMNHKKDYERPRSRARPSTRPSFSSGSLPMTPAPENASAAQPNLRGCHRSPW